MSTQKLENPFTENSMSVDEIIQHARALRAAFFRHYAVSVWDAFARRISVSPAPRHA